MGQVIQGRAGIFVENDWALVAASVRRFASAVIIADTTDPAAYGTRYVIPAAASIDADTYVDDPLAAVSDPANPIPIDATMADPNDVLLYNLPQDTSQIITLIQQQLALADLSESPTTLTYDNLPDPGSFIPSLTNYL